MKLVPRRSFRAAAGVAAGLFCVGALADVTHSATLTPGETTYGSFGYSEGIAVNGDTAIIGAYSAGSPGAYGYGDGKAYVFTNGQSGWTREALTSPSFASYPSYFGWQVGLSGPCTAGGVQLDHAAIVSTLPYYSPGVWVYTKPTSTGIWSGPTALPDVASPESSAISGTTILVGEYGQAHVYAPHASSGWASPQHVATLTGPAGSSGEFGVAVDIDGDTAVVSDPYAEDGYGAAYVFKRSGGSWTNTATLTNPSSYQYGYFPYRVAVSGDHVIAMAVNEPRNDGYGVTTIFDLASDGTWAGDYQVLDVSGMASYYVNNEVAINGNLAAVAGYAEWRFFSRQSDGSWTPEHDELVSPVSGPGGVAIDGTTVIVGNRAAGTPNPNWYDVGDGEAYVLGGLPQQTADTTPPTISVSVSPNRLWPPNHQLVTINKTVSASDDSGAAPTVTLVSITSNEADNGLGDGDTANDIQVAGNGTIRLRAERRGGGNGRVYTLTYRATDAAGNSATATATVTVPRNNSGN